MLRAWEHRYGLLRPVRTPNGFRLYSELDEWRVRLMQEQLWSGVSAREAARAVRTAEREREGQGWDPDVAVRIGRFADEFTVALEAFDEERVHASLDRLFAVLGVELAIRDVLLPYLRDLGERWARAENRRRRGALRQPVARGAPAQPRSRLEQGAGTAGGPHLPSE